MQRKRMILLAAACGAVIGALSTRHGIQGLNIPAFAPDIALLAHGKTGGLHQQSTRSNVWSNDIPGGGRPKILVAVIAGKGNVMELARLLVAPQHGRHTGRAQLNT